MSPRDDGGHDFDPDAFVGGASDFVLEDFNTLTAGEVFWLVKSLWPVAGVCFLYGPWGAGKSFWALDACSRICRGDPVLGSKSVQAGVLYVGAEDPNGIRLRIEGLRKSIGPLPADTFKFVGGAPDLRDPNSVAMMRATILEARAKMDGRGIRLGLVVIDTMSAVTPGADENTARDMGPALKVLQALSVELSLLFLIVAHPGKDETRGIRGWYGIPANADGVIKLEEPDDSGLRGGVVQKVKNGPDGHRFGFTLTPVIVRQDREGTDVTTCIIKDAEPAPAKNDAKGSVLAATVKIVLTAYGRAYDEVCVPIYAAGAIGQNGVAVQQLRGWAFELGLGGPEPLVGEDVSPSERAADRRRWQDRRNKQFTRALEHLLATKRLRQEGELIWETFAKRGPT